MKHRSISKIVSFIVLFAMVLSLASCKPEGSLKLESLTIDRTSIKMNYFVGEAIDFSGIKAIARYSDETLDKIYTYSELTISYAEDITATAGDKEVTVSFDDPHLNVKQETKIIIKVTDPIVDDGKKTLVAVQFEKPFALTRFDSANANAGSIKHGETGFYGQFAVGGKTYVIGNENEFKFKPQFSVITDDNTVQPLLSFFSVVDIYIEKFGSYVPLAKTSGENNSVTYTYGNTLIATVDTYNGIYRFSNEAAGNKIKISVLPSSKNYVTADQTPFNPIVLEANVIKAYNVYEAWQLAVIDNCNSAWADKKAEHGLLDVNVSGIVLHNDVTLTANDVPASFFYTTESEVIYTNATDNSTVTVPAGTKYLKDEFQIYHRAGGVSFVVEGNFFTLNTNSFPRVASPAVFGTDAEKDYGHDFSEVSLFYFSEYTNDEEFKADLNAENSLVVTMNNLSLIGNAKRDNLVDANQNLASAGGLIFVKSSYAASIKIDNFIGNSYFITYFANNGKLNLKNSKCVDSYQNAVLALGRCEVNVTDSYLEGCGGPVIICMSYTKENLHPVTTVKNTLVKTIVSGEELWFASIGVTSMVGTIKGLSQSLSDIGLGTFVGTNGKMNLKGVLMSTGTDASSVISGINAQGSILIDGSGINRNQTAENIHWAMIKQISELAMTSGSQLPPFFTVYDDNGVAHTLLFNGTGFADITNTPLGSSPTHTALIEAFKNADAITLTQGGVSIVFEFYHN